MEKKAARFYDGKHVYEIAITPQNTERVERLIKQYKAKYENYPSAMQNIDIFFDFLLEKGINVKEKRDDKNCNLIWLVLA